MITNNHRINLNGKEIIYAFKCSQRKSIGLKITGDGLTVCAPLSQSQHQIELVIRNKANWIIGKLAQLASRKTTRLTWRQDTIFLLLGEPWKITTQLSGIIQMVPAKLKVAAKNNLLPPNRIKLIVTTWYDQQATVYFSRRITYYANKLNLPSPQLRLSRAKTQWGSCNARGVVRLNWRLIQMSASLIDYVVAHELSHLVEMNHSPNFWRVLASIYPNYVAARKELKTYDC